VTTFPPITHIALTVRDLSISLPWYEALFGSGPDFDQGSGAFSRRPTFRIGNGMLFALHQHPWLPLDSAFSEFRAGFDHVAFGCADEAEVEKRSCRLDELGIEHGQIRGTQYGSALSFRDPDGIALEFFAPPGT
jgi:glyoxylase I family protein